METVQDLIDELIDFKRAADAVAKSSIATVEGKHKNEAVSKILSHVLKRLEKIKQNQHKGNVNE